MGSSTATAFAVNLQEEQGGWAGRAGPDATLPVGAEKALLRVRPGSSLQEALGQELTPPTHKTGSLQGQLWAKQTALLLLDCSWHWASGSQRTLWAHSGCPPQSNWWRC